MRMNRLGNSDLVVSAVGAGTWAMGGDFFGAIDVILFLYRYIE